MRCERTDPLDYTALTRYRNSQGWAARNPGRFPTARVRRLARYLIGTPDSERRAALAHVAAEVRCSLAEMLILGYRLTNSFDRQAAL